MKSPILALLLGVLCFSACTEETQTSSYTNHVNVFIGTGGHGHTFPGATLPNGMVQLSPDTRLEDWDACGGYYYTDTSLHGFSHTHLSGTGISDYGDILFMPVVGETPLVAGHRDNPEAGYRSTFSHEKESARPGYYQVVLDDYQINAELTATTRAGMHRYTYPKGSDARLIIDMEPSIYEQEHPVTQIAIVNDSTIAGMEYTIGWAKKHTVYFYAVFSSPFEYRLYSDTTPQPDSTSVTVETAKAVLTFKNLPADGKLLAKVGISNVDKEGARRNLQTEIPHWDFDGVVKQADQGWNDRLGKVEIETSDADARTTFYTALYHAYLMPATASDVDGRFLNMRHEIEREPGYTAYTVFSLWDTFRAAHPLYSILTPDLNNAFVRTLIRKYEEGGILPKWELSSNETGTMSGYHAVSVIGDAMMKGGTGFDYQKALKACIRSSVYDTTGITPIMDRKILHESIMSPMIQYKNEWGYIPCDKNFHAPTSQGLEFAYSDWLIAQMAKKLGNEEVYEKYSKLGQNYRQYFDPATKFMRGRTSNGGWYAPFDPVSGGGGYEEGNAWQWAWFVPQDVEGLMELVGSKELFEARLDSLFTISSDMKNVSADVTGLIGQYAHGNEPSHHIPYLYNYAGNPRKTQALVDHILRTLYSNDVDGLCGNEDVGQMSSWYVLSAMGFYSFCPGKPEYEIGRPLFDKVTLHLENGKKFVIRAVNNSKENKYIQSMKLNGKALDEPRFSHFDLMNGGELVLEMGL